MRDFLMLINDYINSGRSKDKLIGVLDAIDYDILEDDNIPKITVNKEENVILSTIIEIEDYINDDEKRSILETYKSIIEGEGGVPC